MAPAMRVLVAFAAWTSRCCAYNSILTTTALRTSVISAPIRRRRLAERMAPGVQVVEAPPAVVASAPPALLSLEDEEARITYAGAALNVGLSGLKGVVGLQCASQVLVMIQGRKRGLQCHFKL